MNAKDALAGIKDEEKSGYKGRKDDDRTKNGVSRSSD